MRCEKQKMKKSTCCRLTITVLVVTISLGPVISSPIAAVSNTAVTEEVEEQLTQFSGSGGGSGSGDDGRDCIGDDEDCTLHVSSHDNNNKINEAVTGINHIDGNDCLGDDENCVARGVHADSNNEDQEAWASGSGAESGDGKDCLGDDEDCVALGAHADSNNKDQEAWASGSGSGSGEGNDCIGDDEDCDETGIMIKSSDVDAIRENGPIAKHNIVLDVKPWDDETDLAEMERLVRTIQRDGLLWGTSKFVPYKYGIRQLRISCVAEDDKVGTDLLEKEITKFEDLVQSVDVAALNKV